MCISGLTVLTYRLLTLLLTLLHFLHPHAIKLQDLLYYEEPNPGYREGNLH